MFEQIILGIVQGITEWLPVSSEGVLALLQRGTGDIESMIRSALLLHFGTFLAALIYFRKDVAKLLKALLEYRRAESENKKVLNFLIIATVLSGLIGIILIKLLAEFYGYLERGGQALALLIGLALLVTAYLQIRAKKGRGYREASQLEMKDGVLLGVMQGLAVLPGLSRSGLTVSALLLKKFDDACALKLSFLMSLPIVLFGNLILNLEYLAFSPEMLAGLAASFIFGLLTIDLLLRLAKKINFGYFVLAFGILVLASVFV